MADGKGGSETIPARTAFAATGLACFGLAAAAPLVVRFVAKGLVADVARSVTLGALKSPWVLQPVFAKYSAPSTSWLFVVMSLGFLAVLGMTTLLSRGKFFSIRRVPVWRPATPGVHGEDSYNAFAFANPVRHVLSNILGTQKEVETVDNGGWPTAMPAGPAAPVSGAAHTWCSGPALPSRWNRTFTGPPSRLPLARPTSQAPPIGPFGGLCRLYARRPGRGAHPGCGPRLRRRVP